MLRPNRSARATQAARGRATSKSAGRISVRAAIVGAPVPVTQGGKSTRPFTWRPERTRTIYFSDRDDDALAEHQKATNYISETLEDGNRSSRTATSLPSRSPSHSVPRLQGFIRWRYGPTVLREGRAWPSGRENGCLCSRAGAISHRPTSTLITHVGVVPSCLSSDSHAAASKSLLDL
jgi:hypothetical protein